MVKQIGKRVLRNVLGVVFLILGVAGLFLPILQGILFLFIGFALLAPDVPFLQRIGRRLRERYPRRTAQLHDARERLARRWRRRLRLRSNNR